jgi:hypothetical protein
MHVPCSTLETTCGFGMNAALGSNSFWSGVRWDEDHYGTLQSAFVGKIPDFGIIP